MIRTLLAFAAGASLVVLLMRPDPRHDPETTSATSSERVTAEAVIELDDPTPRLAGIPPTTATGVVRGDSIAARRQSVARVLRDLAGRPAAVPPAEHHPDATAAFTESFRAALAQGVNP